jgi:putative flippase GtrA
MHSAIRFVVTGLLATATHASAFVMLIELASLRAVYAAVCSFLVALGVSYTLNYHWTFKAGGRHRVALPRFVLVALVGLILNIGITYLVVDIWSLWYGYALIAVVTAIPVVTYVLSRFWAFR